MRDKKQEKTYVEDVSRSVYDIRNEEKDVYRVDRGPEPRPSSLRSRKKRMTRPGCKISVWSP